MIEKDIYTIPNLVRYVTNPYFFRDEDQSQIDSIKERLSKDEPHQLFKEANSDVIAKKLHKCYTEWVKEAGEMQGQRKHDTLYQIGFIFQELVNKHPFNHYLKHAVSLNKPYFEEYLNEINKMLKSIETLEKADTEPIKSPVSIEFKLNEEVNLFCKGMPLNVVREHFSVLTTNISKGNKKPFLTNEQFEAFIKRAFLNDKSIEPIILNYSKTKENLFIVKRFYQFYDKAITDDYTTRNDSKEKYIKILTDNFSEWEFDKVLQNFGDKVKRSWIEAKV